MSNRFLGILIILWFIWAGYIYYHLKYIPGQHQKEVERQEDIKAAKELEDQPKLVIQEGVDTIDNISSIGKIEEIKEKNNSYFYKTLWTSENIKFLENNNKLDVFLDNEYLWDFPMVESSEIDVQTIINNQGYLYLSLWKDKFLYNLKSKKITTIPLNVEVEYVKEWKDTGEFLFKTSVGIYVYSILEDTIEYVHFFKDFVYYIDEKTLQYWYIWIIKNDEDKKLEDLWFNALLSGDSYRSLVVFYSPISKEKRILLESLVDVAYIYTSESEGIVNIFIIDELWEKYRVENI